MKAAPQFYRIWLKGFEHRISPAPCYRNHSKDFAIIMLRQIEKEVPELKGRLVIA